MASACTDLKAVMNVCDCDEEPQFTFGLLVLTKARVGEVLLKWNLDSHLV